MDPNHKPTPPSIPDQPDKQEPTGPPPGPTKEDAQLTEQTRQHMANIDEPFCLDHVQGIDIKSFPNQPLNASGSPPATIPNVIHLLQEYGIVARYDVIKKKLRVAVPGHFGTHENADNVALSQIISLATLNGMPSGKIPDIIATIGDRNQYNPVADWITSIPWDLTDRLPAFYDSLVEREGYPKDLKHTLMRRWGISAVAAAMKPSGFYARGVLTLQGPQSIGKTSWIRALVPKNAALESLIRLDHHLDAGTKDSLLTAVSHWIVEIGELDSSFKKDIARLKGFLTSDQDKVRRPYARGDSEYRRRTVFCATVNAQNFLVDATGNSRWWTIPVEKIKYDHGIDTQQLFAQLAVEYRRGEAWWLTQAEEESLELQNKDHHAVSALRERLLDELDLERPRDRLPAMTPTELLQSIGMKNPTNRQCQECGGILRELFGDPKRINGRDRWRVPIGLPF